MECHLPSVELPADVVAVSSKLDGGLLIAEFSKGNIFQVKLMKEEVASESACSDALKENWD